MDEVVGGDVVVGDVVVDDVVVDEFAGGAVVESGFVDETAVDIVEVGPSDSAPDSPLLAAMKPAIDTTISSAPAPINTQGNQRCIENPPSLPNLTQRPTAARPLSDAFHSHAMAGFTMREHVE